MKVDIKTVEEKTGFISKTTWQVVMLTVQFTEEEKQIIKDNDLGKVVIMENVWDDQLGSGTNYDIRWFVASGPMTVRTAYKSKGDAAAFVEAAKAAMVQTKEYLTKHGEAPEDTSFEL